LFEATSVRVDRQFDVRDLVAEERDRRADERDRLADERDQGADEQEARMRRLVGNRAGRHAVAAAFAERMATDADELAACLEAAADRGDSDRRLRVAAVEREVARIQRRNAARLRQAGDQPVELEHLPRLPRLDGPDQTD
jgi:hypothetical protein